ncbi:MAG: hypothetical protein OEZ57_15555 [Nitrospirota bacterium]|nr:hypothetical protein [Nitrospirota bacterium]
MTPEWAVARCGQPMVSPSDPVPTRETIHAPTATIMLAIQDNRQHN